MTGLGLRFTGPVVRGRGRIVRSTGPINFASGRVIFPTGPDVRASGRVVFASVRIVRASGPFIRETGRCFRFRDLRDFSLIRTFRRLAQGKKSLLQGLADGAVRLLQHKNLVLVEEIFAKPMKQMEEMA